MKILSKPEWYQVPLTRNYRVTFILLGEHLLLSVPEGTSHQDGIDRLWVKREEFIQLHHLRDKGYVEIKDYSAIGGRISLKARNRFIERLKEESPESGFLGFWGYNGGTLLNWSFNVASYLYEAPFPAKIVKDYYTAVISAYSLLLSRGLEKKESHKGGAFVIPQFWKGMKGILNKPHRRPWYSSKTIRAYARDFLTFISGLNWNMEEGERLVRKIPQGHPFKSLYESMYLIKADFDSVIEENRQKEEMLEAKVTERTQELEQRDALLRHKNDVLETSLDILSHDTKNLFFNITNLLVDVEDHEVQAMLKENIDELFGLTMEATGFLKEKKRIIDLVEMVKKIRVTRMRIPMESHPRITLDHEAPDQLFVETSALFKNAIYNLVENALKYTPEDREIRVSLSREGKQVVIRVIDQGQGIPDDEKEQILDRYYRLKKDAAIEGSGRGLWITKNIVCQVGGTLSIEDNPLGGAVFVISLDAYEVKNFEDKILEMASWFNLSPERMTHKADSVRTLLTLQGRSDIAHMDTAVFANLLSRLREENSRSSDRNIHKRLERLKLRNEGAPRILVVDDSVYVQYYLAKYLVDLGFQIAGYAENGELAIKAYKELSPHCMTLDNTMPVMSGIEAAQEIFVLDQKVRFVFISGLGDSVFYNEELAQLFPEENYQVLTKPIEKQQLSRALTALLKDE